MNRIQRVTKVARILKEKFPEMDYLLAVQLAVEIVEALDE
jgi:hypothetical protein